MLKNLLNFRGYKNLKRIPHLVNSILFIIIFITGNLYAQAPQWDWVKTAKGSLNWPSLESRSVAADTYSNSYITGSCYYCDTISFDNITLTSNSGGAMYVVKYDSSGNVLWARFDGDNNATYPTAIATDASDNIYVTGTFATTTTQFGTYTLTNTNPASYEVFLVKYSSTGNVIWAKSMGGPESEWSESVSTDFAGNVFITGSFLGSSITFGSSTLTNTNANTEDIFIAKFDSNGTELWAKSAGGTNHEWAISVTTDDFGNSFICGRFWSSSVTFDNIILNSNGGAHMFTASYDKSGNIRWVKPIYLSLSSLGGYLYSLSTDAFGNVYVTGNCLFADTAYIDGFHLTSYYINSYTDMIIAKYDTSGNAVWAKRIFSTGDLYPMAIAVNSASESYVAGYYSCDSIYFDSSNVMPTNIYYYEGLYIVKYSANGNFLWSKIVDGGAIVDGTYTTAEMGITTNILGNVWVIGSNYYDSIPYDTFTTYIENCSQNIFLTKLNDSKECSAYFELVPDSVTPHKYWIINLATGASPISYLWEWGDGTTDTGAYPNHIYAAQGFYTICLTITDSSGCTDTKCFTYNLQKMTGTMIEVSVIPPVINSVLNNSNVEDTFSIYPNPVNNEAIITFSLNGSSFVNLELFNSIGQQVNFISKNKYEPGNHQIIFSMSKLKSGLYYLQYKTDEYTGVIKIVKM